MNNNGHIELYSEVVFVKDIPLYGIKCGEKAYVIADITSNDVLIRNNKNGYTNWVVKDTLMLASIYANKEISFINDNINSARVSAQGALVEFLSALESTKQFIEGKLQCNSDLLHKKFVDLLSAIHYLDRQMELLSDLKS